MIDLHSHILPGIDDGPATLEESVEMCRMAASDGVKTIVATPHFNPPLYNASSATVFGLIETLNHALEKEGIEIEILAGAEVIISPDMAGWVKNEEHLALNKGRYVIIEFPPAVMPPDWQGFLSGIRQNGLVPIIAHPERNPWFSANPKALGLAIGNGALVQITAMSLTDGFGREARAFGEYLLKRNMAHIIASDAHSALSRPPCLSEALARAEALIGREQALAMVIDIPSAILGNAPVRLPEPAIEAPGRTKGGWVQRLSRPLKKSICCVVAAASALNMPSQHASLEALLRLASGAF